MRILFATSITTWGGGEEWMLSNAVGLRDRGHDVRLIAPGGSAIRERAVAARIAGAAAGFVSDADFASYLTVRRESREQNTQVLCLNMDRVLRVGGTAARHAGVPACFRGAGASFP